MYLCLRGGAGASEPPAFGPLFYSNKGPGVLLWGALMKPAGFSGNSEGNATELLWTEMEKGSLVWNCVDALSGVLAGGWSTFVERRRGVLSLAGCVRARPPGVDVI